MNKIQFFSSVAYIGCAVVLIVTYLTGLDDLVLLSFPLITWTFATFFRSLSQEKKYTHLLQSKLIYQPLGEEANSAKILSVGALIQSLILLFQTVDSKSHPQLIDNYGTILLYIGSLVQIGAFSLVILAYWDTQKISFGENILSRIQSDVLNAISHKWLSISIISIALITIESVFLAFSPSDLNLYQYSASFPGNTLEGADTLLVPHTILLCTYLLPAIYLGLLLKGYRSFTPIKTEILKNTDLITQIALQELKNNNKL